MTQDVVGVPDLDRQAKLRGPERGELRRKRGDADAWHNRKRRIGNQKKKEEIENGGEEEKEDAKNIKEEEREGEGR
jgi:hypothetical protein